MVSAKWVYSWKVNKLGHVVRAKARLIARGFAQPEGIDETFSPCPSIASIRLLAAIACEFGWDLCRFDAEQAFVQWKFEEVVFIRLPPGRGELSGTFVKLGRSLYGLRQSSRTWHNHLMRGLKCLRFEACAADACVWAVARYSHAPKRLHWRAAMHILMYVRFTSNFGIAFQRGMVGGDRMELFID